jgi:5-methylcytosine-specific restriction endonuclease McrA
MKESTKRAIQKYHATDKGKHAQQKAISKWQRTDEGKKKHREYIKTYLKTPRGKLSRRNARLTRKARKLNQLGPNPPSTQYLQELLSVSCAYCEQPSEQIDHIIPLSKGGLHDISNLVGACKKCNLSKRDKSVEEFLTGDTNGRDLRNWRDCHLP